LTNAHHRRHPLARWIAVALLCAGAGLSTRAVGPGTPAVAAPAKPSPAIPGSALFGMAAVISPSAAEFKRMGRLGAVTCRLQLHWGRIEDPFGLGLRDWRDFDAMVADAAAAGVQVLPLLHGVPRFIAHSSSTPPLRSRYERAKWGQFVSDAVRRYGPGGTFWAEHPLLPKLPVTAWQVWNEPNLPNNFGGKVDVSQYRDLLRMTAQAIHAVDPEAEVVTAGIFKFDVGPGAIPMGNFVKRLYRLKGVEQWFDVLALHPYSVRPKGVLASVRAVRRTMRRERDGRTPVWVTEVGWSTGGSGWQENAFRATQRQQAWRLRRTYRLFARKRKLRVERAYWHNFQDFDHPKQPDPWMSRMGLLTLRGGRKPAWYAYARVAGGSP